jgi:DNA-binding transcriptional MocR family regulator
MSQVKTIQDEHVPLWLPRLAGNKGPRFLQIADALQAAVVDGSLKSGDRLPPQRQLAAQLDVDLTTITRAYDEARRRNLLEGRGARGTYVAAPKVELTSILDLSMNTPPPPDGVDFDDLMKQGLSQVLMRADNGLLMTYHLGGEATPTARLAPNGSNRCLDIWTLDSLLSVRARRPRSPH